MAIIIDAYNVLHCTHVLPGDVTLATAVEMCRMLETSRFADQRCVVVCDGVSKPLDADYHGPVSLRYSGHASDADTVIERLIEADTAPRQLIVVSNDRRLRTAARRRRARAMSSETFLHLLVTWPRHPADPDAKPTVVANPDYWLEQFQLDPTPAPGSPGSLDSFDSPAPAEAPSPPSSQSVPPQPPASAPEETSGGDDIKTHPKPGETEIQYWLREFGFEEEDRSET